MNAAPKGKIGRLPKAIREQVNRRLEHGEQARRLVALGSQRHPVFFMFPGRRLR